MGAGAVAGRAVNGADSRGGRARLSNLIYERLVLRTHFAMARSINRCHDHVVSTLKPSTGFVSAPHLGTAYYRYVCECRA